MDYTYCYDSPLGTMTMASDGDALVGLWFNGQRFFGATLDARCETRRLPIFDETARWLDLYFARRAPDFKPKLTLRTTPFRRAIAETTRAIPFGAVSSYGAIATAYAERYGAPRVSAQAVGAAVARNPIAIIIPCHRVLARDGDLKGYAAGLDRKRALLELERGSALPTSLFAPNLRGRDIL